MAAIVINRFIDSLARIKAEGPAYNPYQLGVPANEVRRENLRLYFYEMLEREPKVMLLGEAPGYQGCRLSGLPFTSEFQLLTGIEKFGLLGAEKGYRKTDEFERIYKEPTGTVMWGTLSELNFLPLLWATFPFHPHKPDNPQSNRAPTRQEIEFGKDIFQDLMKIFGIKKIVAVGNVAHGALTQIGIEA